MRKITVAGGSLMLSLMAVSVDAQMVGASVDLRNGLKENIAPIPFLSVTALEGPGSEIGATVRGLRPEESAAHLNMEHGVVVESVAKDSPASRAGLKPGDMIFFYARGVDIDKVRAFARFVHDTPPGRVLPVAVVRDGVRIGMALIPELGRAGASEQP